MCVQGSPGLPDFDNFRESPGTAVCGFQHGKPFIAQRSAIMVSHGHLVSQTEDGDLKRRVVNYLFERRVASLRSIEVTAQAGRVTLQGRVGSFYEKQLCIHCCRRVAGVRQLVDNVLVIRPD
jgi:osmotically-inducible protein OsmY